MLWKILEKFFITKNFTQSKTSRTFKIDKFKISDNKNIRNFFSKYELLFFDQTNSSSGSSQLLILQFPIPRSSLPPSLSLSNFALANGNPYPKQSSSCFSSVSVFCPTRFNHISPQFIIKLYSDHNTLTVKYTSHQKAESLTGAYLSKLDNTVNSNSIFTTKYVEFPTKW